MHPILDIKLIIKDFGIEYQLKIIADENKKDNDLNFTLAKK